MFNNFLIHGQTLLLPYSIHVFPSNVIIVCFLPKMQQLLISRRNPEWVARNNLQSNTQKLA